MASVSFVEPTPCDEDESRDSIRAFDDFDDGAVHLRQSGFEFLVGVTAVGEDLRDGLGKLFASEADDARRLHSCPECSLRI